MKLERQDHLAMTAIVFDSLSMMKRLRGTGLTEEQSVAIIDVTRDSLVNLATRDDVEGAVQRGLHGLDPKFASLEQRFVPTDKRFSDIDRRLDGIDERFVHIDKRFSAIDKRLDGVDKRLDGMDKRLDGIDQRLAQIDQRFIILEHRMTIKLGTIVVVALGAFTALSKWIA
jgi:tetrahydromethanopterin S-methyltransferase subunit G